MSETIEQRLEKAEQSLLVLTAELSASQFLVAILIDSIPDQSKLKLQLEKEVGEQADWLREVHAKKHHPFSLLLAQSLENILAVVASSTREQRAHGFQLSVVKRDQTESEE